MLEQGGAQLDLEANTSSQIVQEAIYSHATKQRSVYSSFTASEIKSYSKAQPMPIGDSPPPIGPKPQTSELLDTSTPRSSQRSNYV